MPDVSEERLAVMGSQERALLGGRYHVGQLQIPSEAACSSRVGARGAQKARSSLCPEPGGSQQHSWLCIRWDTAPYSCCRHQVSCCDPKPCAPSLITTITDADIMDFHICTRVT